MKNCFYSVVLISILQQCQSVIYIYIYKRSVLAVHWKDWCWSWNSNTLATSWEELTHLTRPWCWERLRAGGEGATEDEVVGWHHQLSGHGFGWTSGVADGQGGLACCGSWCCKESDTTERLNWPELLCWFLLYNSANQSLYIFPPSWASLPSPPFHPSRSSPLFISLIDIVSSININWVLRELLESFEDQQ